MGKSAIQKSSNDLDISLLLNASGFLIWPKQEQQTELLFTLKNETFISPSEWNLVSQSPF